MMETTASSSPSTWAAEPDAFADAFHENRRSQPRVPLTARVDLRSEDNLFVGFSSDVSQGGVFVATYTLLPIGAEVELTLALPGTQPFTARAEVRWRREVDELQPDETPGMGLKFHALSDEGRAALEQFIRAPDPLFFPD